MQLVYKDMEGGLLPTHTSKYGTPGLTTQLTKPLEATSQHKIGIGNQHKHQYTQRAPQHLFCEYILTTHPKM